MKISTNGRCLIVPGFIWGIGDFNMKKAFVFLLCIVCLAGCTAAAGTKSDARTYYDSLALDTPEAAAQSFITAFQASDFQTVYLILSPRAQRTWKENYAQLNWPLIFRVKNQKEVDAILENTAIAQGKFEHSGETSYEFDELMLAAQTHDLLLVDLGGKLTVQSTQEARDTVGNPATDVIIQSSRYDEPLVFRMVQAPSGKWRVYQVIIPGGNEDYVPWAVRDVSFED